MRAHIRRIRKIEAALKPKGQEVFVAVEYWPCMSEAEVEEALAREVRQTLGREPRDEDHLYLVTWRLDYFGLTCPYEAHTHPRGPAPEPSPRPPAPPPLPAAPEPVPMPERLPVVLTPPRPESAKEIRYRKWLQAQGLSPDGEAAFDR